MSPATIALSLISHTNAGKTTLARTLLGRDVGEVRDAQHVTLDATSHSLQTTGEGDELLLWDTPGFGDSARLARRLAQQGNPIGWFLSQVWDRFRNRPLYLAQKAVRNVRDDADVVLYLVNASEMPGDAGYVAHELDVLAWVGRPVFVLLNQTGPPRPRHEDEAEQSRWREAVGQRALVRGVLTLDAFARCWVQEIVLLQSLAPAIREDKREGYERLVAAWQSRRFAQFDEAMAALAAPIAAAACDYATLPTPAFKDKLRGAIRGWVGGAKDDVSQPAAKLLAERLDSGIRDSLRRLIAIHGLEGGAADAVRERLADGVRTDAPMDESKAAMLGGVLSGALSGLATDLAAGGLTLGAGTLIGAIAGALGGAGIARGYNVMKGRTESVIRWDDELLDRLVSSALLRYLAVAHYGRGRGEWTHSEYAPHWGEIVEREVAVRRDALHQIWALREKDAISSPIEEKTRKILAEIGLAVLDDCYPSVLDKARPLPDETRLDAPQGG